MNKIKLQELEKLLFPHNQIIQLTKHNNFDNAVTTLSPSKVTISQFVLMQLRRKKLQDLKKKLSKMLVKG